MCTIKYLEYSAAPEVEYLDMNWKKQNLKLDGWIAQICQHELDHWEGILI